MTKTQSSKSGCFSAVIRRILCAGNVPTHPSSSPSGQTPHSDVTKLDNPEKRHVVSTKPDTEPQPGPGLVARLMGLDSLPPSIDFAPKSLTPDHSLSRSRSVNFADYLLKFDPNSSLSHQHRRHRRVRTSVSFREVPASFKQPSGDFVVVYLDKVSESMPEKEKSEKKKKKKREYEKPINNDKISRLKNEQRRKVSPKAMKNCKGKNGGAKVLGSVLATNGNVKSKVLKKENEKKVPENFTRKRKNHNGNKKIRSIESNTESLSPVSVLKDTLFSDGRSKTKTKSETKITHHGNEDFESRSTEKKNCGNIPENNNENGAIDFAELAGELLRLTERDLSQSCWFGSTENVKEFEGFEDICMEFQELLLDALLNEFAYEIVQIY